MTPILTISDARQLESINSRPDLEFVVALSEASAAPVNYTIRSFDGTATEAQDFFGRFDTFTIPAGQLQQTVIVEADSDTVTEGDESFFVEVSNVAGAVLEAGALTTRALGIIEDDDGDDRPALFVKGLEIVEGNGGARSAVFEVTLSRPFAGPVSIPFETRGVTAVPGQDFTQTASMLDFGAGSTTGTVTVPILTDTAIEQSETFDLVFDTSGLDLASPIGSTVATATILDDDAGGGFLPVLSLEGASVVESVNSRPDIEFTLSLSAPAPTDVTYTARSFDGTATEARDFFAQFGTFTIPAGQTTQTFIVEADSDSLVEGDESLFLDITNLTGAVFAGGARNLRAAGIILDDDGDSRPALFVQDVEIVEGDAGGRVAVFDVILSRPFSAPVSVPFQTVSKSAVADEDFTPVTGTVDFAPGQTRGSISVAVAADTDVEATETFDLVLDTTGLDLVNGAAGAVGTATILDDDAGSASLPVLSILSANVVESANSRPDIEFTLALSAPAPTDVTYTARSFDGTATEGRDFFARFGTFTIPAGQTTQTFIVEADSDTVVEGDESLGLLITNVAGAVLDGGASQRAALSVIIDDDGDNRPALFVADQTVTEGNSGTSTVHMEVVLTRVSDTPVTVNYTTVPRDGADIDDISGTSGTLTFLPGQTRQTVSFEVTGDTDIEPTERVDLVLSRPDGADFVEGGSGTSGTLTILDDDSGGGGPVLSIADVSQFESATSRPDLEFLVSLSEPAPGDVTVEFDTASGTAIEGDDFFARDAILTIPAGATSGVIVVEANSDTAPEPDETFFLDLSNITGAAFEGGQSSLRATGTILDDDSGAAVLPALIVEDVSVAEPAAGQTTATFTIASPVPAGLAIQGNFEILGGTAEAGSDFLAQSGSFTIPGGSFTTTISVPILADGVAEGDETLVLRLSDIQNAGSGNRAGEVFAIGTITEGGGPAPAEIRLTNGSRGPEGDSGPSATAYNFGVARSGDTGVEVTVDYAVTGLGSTPADPADFPGGVFPSGSITLPAGATSGVITIRAEGDTEIEPDERFTVTLTNPTNGATITQATATGTIENDDGAAPNQPPVAIDDIAVTPTGQAVTVDVLANDTDPENDSLILSTVGAASNGTVAIVNGQARYTPDAGFFGADRFEYTVADGNGGVDTGTVTVAVQGGPAPLGVDGNVRGTGRDDVLTLAQNANYLGGGGDDIYLISQAMLPGRVAVINDNDADRVQLVEGLAIASSAVAGNAIQLTLANGAVVQILNAGGLDFEIGGNATTGAAGTVEDFAAFTGGTLDGGGPVLIGAEAAGSLDDTFAFDALF